MNHLRALSASLLGLSLICASAAGTVATTERPGAAHLDGSSTVRDAEDLGPSPASPLTGAHRRMAPAAAEAGVSSLPTQEQSEAAQRAAAYLSLQVTHGHVEDDVELTAWVTLALLAAGGHGSTVEATTGWLSSRAPDPTLTTADRAAIILALTAQGRDARSVAGTDLVATVRADAADDGRCSTTNVAVGTSLCAVALHRAGEAVPPVALGVLLSLADPEDAGLTHAGALDAWASALGLQALAMLDGTHGARGAGLGVRDFLVGWGEVNGSFDSGAPVVLNALVAQSLLGVDEHVSAHLDWLTSMQLPSGASVTAYDTLQADVMATAMTALALTGHGIGTVGVSGPGTSYGPHPYVWRTTGGNRYEVAANIALAWDSAWTVVVASGESFSDAIPGSALAARHGGPILLTKAGTLPAPTVAALRRLKPRHIYIMGGEATVSSSVETALRQYVQGGNLIRISGDDRYAVAMNAAYRYQSEPRPTRAYLATGLNWPDGLTGSAVAGTEGAPVVLSRKESVPASVLNNLRYLGVKEVVILGGTASISANAEAQLEAAGYATRRVSGADRYAVAANVSRDARPGPHAFVATGANWPDALAAGPLAAALEAPLLLTRPSSVPAATAGRIVEEQAAVISLFGGPVSINPAAATGLRLLRTDSPFQP